MFQAQAYQQLAKTLRHMLEKILFVFNHYLISTISVPSYNEKMQRYKVFSAKIILKVLLTFCLLGGLWTRLLNNCRYKN